MDDQQLQQLLRLKTCELPAPDSVERFIVNFHRRQREAAFTPSLLETFKERLSFFFSDFQVPTMAYVAATAITVFLSVVILRDPHFNHATSYASDHSFSHKLSSPVDSFSSPVMMNQIEPVSWNIKSNDRNDDSVISPLSYTLKKKSQLPHGLLSF